MLKVYLMRHGDAVSEGTDPQRPLSKHGVREVEKVTEYLKTKHFQVGTILHSTKLRAVQTAKMIHQSCCSGAKLIEQDGLLPNDHTDEISMCTSDILIVGHLPFLPRLAGHLVANDESKNVINLKTAAVVAIEKNYPKEWQIIWSVSPDQI